MAIEIERKFLLKGMPSVEPHEIIDINQWYWKNKEGIWERARSWNSNKTGLKWVHTVKTFISVGVQEEIEKNLTEEEFNKFVERCKLKSEEARYITKQRWIYPVDRGLYWEVDMFDTGHHLVVAEIELPKKSAKFTTPDFIQEKILMEVTSMKQFSNKNLCNKLIK
jgi:CYTH domain-containing protein